MYQTLNAGQVPLHKELAKLNQVSFKQAHKYLEKQGYMPTDPQGNRAALAHILLLLAHCAPPSIIPRGICAVATLLENEAATHTVNGISASIAKRVDLLLKSAEQAIEEA